MLIQIDGIHACTEEIKTYREIANERTNFKQGAGRCEKYARNNYA